MLDIDRADQTPESSPKRKSVLVAGLIVFLLLGNIYLLSRVNRLQIETANVESTLQDQIASLQERASIQAGKAHRDLDALREELATVRKKTASDASTTARRESDRVAKHVSQQQRQQQEQFFGELQDVRATTDRVKSEVTGVQDDLFDVKADLDETKSIALFTESELEDTKGNVGQLRERVEGNQSAIAVLRKMNERDRIGFRLSKSKEMQKIANVQLRLRKTDVKQNKYTLEVLSDDRRVVKKDKNINEPVQFYADNAWQPYEIVITSIAKDQVMGYLSKPKVEMARK